MFTTVCVYMWIHFRAGKNRGSFWGLPGSAGLSIEVLVDAGEMQRLGDFVLVFIS